MGGGGGGSLFEKGGCDAALEVLPDGPSANGKGASKKTGKGNTRARKRCQKRIQGGPYYSAETGQYLTERGGGLEKESLRGEARIAENNKTLGKHPWGVPKFSHL